MKKIIVFTSLLIFTTATFSQQTKPSLALTQQDYLLKSKIQGKTAAILLLGGAACAGFLWLGVTVITKSLTAGAVTFVAGLLAIPISIPFFIAAGQNKKKAMSLSFKNETTPQLQNSSFTKRTIPSLSLKISL